MLSSGAFDGLPAPALRMLNIATRSSDRLIRLINDILDIERIRSGKLPMALEPVAVSLLVETAVREMSGLAASAQVRLEVLACPGQVLADADRVVQTLTNIVGNAVKFSPAGSTVTVETLEQDGEVILRSTTRVAGCPQRCWRRSSSPSSRSTPPTRGPRAGRGSGWRSAGASSSGTAAASGRSRSRGLGTTVSFTLPQAPVDAPGARPAEHPGSAASAGAPRRPTHPV